MRRMYLLLCDKLFRRAAGVQLEKTTLFAAGLLLSHIIGAHALAWGCPRARRQHDVKGSEIRVKTASSWDFYIHNLWEICSI